MTLPTTEIAHIIAGHLSDVSGVPASAIAAETALFSRGVVDSIQILGLVAFLESRFGIAIGSLDISLEHFDSVDALAEFVSVRMEDRR